MVCNVRFIVLSFDAKENKTLTVPHTLREKTDTHLILYSIIKNYLFSIVTIIWKEGLTSGDLNNINVKHEQYQPSNLNRCQTNEIWRHKSRSWLWTGTYM